MIAHTKIILFQEFSFVCLFYDPEDAQYRIFEREGETYTGEQGKSLSNIKN